MNSGEMGSITAGPKSEMGREIVNNLKDILGGESRLESNLVAKSEEAPKQQIAFPYDLNNRGVVV